MSAATTTDSLPGLVLTQHREGYRFSMDAVLLAAFASAVPSSLVNIIDLGAGCGVVGLLMARRFPRASVRLIELQRSLYQLCLRNIRDNAMEGRVTAEHADIAALEGGGCDMIVTNPPFRRPGTGRTGKGEERAGARHEGALTLAGLIAAAARIGAPRARLCIVYHPERLVDLFSAMRDGGYEPKRIRMVHGRVGMEARIALVEAVRGGRASMKVEPPLVIYRDQTRAYTDEVAAMYGG